MLNIFKQLLDSPAPAEPEDPIEVQIAALLIELARADADFDPAERDMIRQLLARHLQEPDSAIDALLDRAEAAADAATSLYPMTSRIHAEYDETQKLALLKQLWQVALADGQIDAHEEHLIRKLAGLLYLPQAAFTQTREAVKAELGLE